MPVNGDNDRFTAEYIWLGGADEFRTKSKAMDGKVLWDANCYPEWSYDGSSTGQANGNDSEVILKPVAVFKDPFARGVDGVLVLCETYYPNGKALPNNYRTGASETFNKKLEAKPWYGIEQEFYLTGPCDNYASQTYTNPLGMYRAKRQGQYYCGVGTNNAFGRKVANNAYSNCLCAGVKVSGMNAEVAPGQWEIQVGPCEGIDAGDHLMMCRYILHRTAEEFNIQVNLDPKLVKGDWNGSGCHVNYSTLQMREDGGYKHIVSAIEKLGIRHEEHMEWYGDGNEDRMTGEHETAAYDKFSYGVANRGASVRIPRQTEKDKKGYFEDRRPASNIDPYVVTSMIFETTILND